MEENEIVIDLLLYKFSEQDKRTLKSMQFEDLIKLHFSLGMEIRNRYHLWSKSNPYVDGNDPEGPNHPDQMSMRIIETCWHKLQ